MKIMHVDADVPTAKLFHQKLSGILLKGIN